MLRSMMTGVLSLSMMAGVPLMVGCDETVSRESETKVKSDGTVEREETKVSRDRDTGVVTKETEKSVDR